jgi:hypothetical protein
VSVCDFSVKKKTLEKKMGKSPGVFVKKEGKSEVGKWGDLGHSNLHLPNQAPICFVRLMPDR